jgi:KUP system potassium uptake protein
MVACVALVVGFGSSDKLASAYGLAVTGTMSITSIAFFVVLTRTWSWPLWRASLLVGSFLVFDLAFLGANLTKFFAGGWVPVGLGLAVFIVMTTWISGRRRLAANVASSAFPLADFVREVEHTHIARVRGTGVFMTANPNGVPAVLLHHYKHNQVLHEQVVLLSIANEAVPYVSAAGRVHVRVLGQGLHQVIAHVGFMEAPDVPKLLAACTSYDLEIDPSRTSYYLGREALLCEGGSTMARWRKELFAIIARNAQSASGYFGIPPNRVVELGMLIEL